jgi:glycosyltransferase involved in cell wall biosynthesis
LKLLFTQDALVNAGAERSHLEILSRFSKEIEIVFVYFYPKHDLKEEYEKAGIRLIFLDIPESYHFRLALTRLIKVIRAEKPDLLISSLWRADIITRIASVISGVLLVGTLVNDSYGSFAWKDKKGIKYKAVYWVDRLTAGIPKHWIANAETLADSHVRTLGLYRNKISVVYRGREVPELVWKSRYVNQLNSKSRDKDFEKERINTYNIISYGRLLERKGFQDAIQAFSKILQKYPNCTLTIFGEGTFRPELEKLVQDLGLKDSIFLPGKISNPFSILTSNSQSYSDLIPKSEIRHPASFNCFLFPSWYEGFSGALIEAMMAGIPIIASNIPMNMEAVNPNTALIFEVQNSEQLAEKMIFAIEHPDQMAQMGANAREEAIARFDIKKIANKYKKTILTVYQSIYNEA